MYRSVDLDWLFETFLIAIHVGRGHATLYLSVSKDLRRDVGYGPLLLCHLSYVTRLLRVEGVS